MYTHITQTKRTALAALLRAGLSQADAAKELGVHPSSVSRELKRNAEADGSYHAGAAGRIANERREESKKGMRKIENDVTPATDIASRLHPLVSPEVVAHDLPVCHETIYAFIYRSRPDLKEKLPQRGRKRRRYGSKREKKQGWARDARSIHERPVKIEKRTEVGHFEGDTVRGLRGALLTLTDRKSRFEGAFLIPAEKCDPVHAVIVKRRKELEPVSFTFDRGSCFSLWRMIERDTGALVYVADAHAPWQRGTNENTNGRIRRVYPKGTDFSILKQRDVDRIVHLMNHTKRKCLSWRTPCEVYGKCCTSG